MKVKRSDPPELQQNFLKFLLYVSSQAEYKKECLESGLESISARSVLVIGVKWRRLRRSSSVESSGGGSAVLLQHTLDPVAGSEQPAAAQVFEAAVSGRRVQSLRGAVA